MTRRLSLPFPLKISETPRPNGTERVSQRVNRGFAHLFTDSCWHQLRKFLRIYRGRVQGSCAFLRSSESSDHSLELQEGLADCIANQDGERQIASAISFHGEETVRVLLFSRISRSHKWRGTQYIGTGAKHQLVKNAENTIIGFRNLLGRK